jgi:hypothetical protein
VEELSWKPLMTLAEAEVMTDRSVYRGQDFFHGTSASSAEGITSHGAKVVSEQVNSYGDGFYLTSRGDRAVAYARQSETPTILMGRVEAQNPKVFHRALDLTEFLVDNDIPFDDNQATAITQLLKTQGFDAVEVKDLGTLVIFNPKQLAIYQVRDL